MKTFNNPDDQKQYEKIFNILKNRFNYDDKIIDDIYDIIVNNTNENLNFEYYKSSYDDIIDDDIISEFISKIDHKYDSIDEIKIELKDYIYEKYFFDNYFYYDEYLVKQLNDIVIEKKDWSIEYCDWSEIINELHEYWYLDLEIDYDSLFINYDCIISTNDDESIFYNWFYNGDYIGDSYTKKQLKENHYTLQDICKYNWFNINDIFYYQKGDEKSKRFQKAKNLYENNPFFKWLYKEYNNYLWYMNWNITNLVKLSIDEILSFFVKWSKFSFWWSWLLWINDSIYELKLDKVLDIPCDKLDLWFYKRSSIAKTYDFNTRYFE